jgi:hypothetical protein
MVLQWYNDTANAIYHGTGYENELPTFTITSERQTYTIAGGEPIPKSGIQHLEFQCANQTGTYYVKILSITPVVYKTITITGISGKTGYVGLFVNNDDHETVALGRGIVSGNSVSFTLKEAAVTSDGGVYMADALWLGSGSYYLDLFFENEERPSFSYRNGQTTPQKYNITSATSTFPFNKFSEDESGGVEIKPGFGPDETIIRDFAIWLSSQPENGPATPYTYKLNVSELYGGHSESYITVGYVLRNNEGKYINLDLSGSTITSIWENVFMQCTSLTSITIPNSVTSIGRNAFYGCDSLTSVIIPTSVTTIGDQAFAGCESLTGITLPVNANFTSIEDNTFYGCRSLASITIPDSVTSIGEGAFYGCRSLASITIPNSVTEMGRWAFRRCTSLTSVTFETGSNIPDSNFGDGAFPEGSNGDGGDNLKTAYSTGKAGTYTRPDGDSTTWTKQP